MLGCVYNDVFHGVAQTARNYGYKYAYGSGYGYGSKYGYGNHGYGYGYGSRTKKGNEDKTQESKTERQVKKDHE